MTIAVSVLQLKCYHRVAGVLWICIISGISISTLTFNKTINDEFLNSLFITLFSLCSYIFIVSMSSPSQFYQHTYNSWHRWGHTFVLRAFCAWCTPLQCHPGSRQTVYEIAMYHFCFGKGRSLPLQQNLKNDKTSRANCFVAVCICSFVHLYKSQSCASL